MGRVSAKNKPMSSEGVSETNGVESSPELEALLSDHLIKTHLVLPEQIQDARDSQRLAREFNMKLSLGEALVKLGFITAAQRSNIETHLVQELERSKKISHFRLKNVLGTGAMGKVYRAEDLAARRDVALKILAPEYAKYPHFLQRFQNEARALGKLNHPNIVAAFDVGEDGGRYYVVMELCEGQSLEERLKNKKPIPHAEALEIALQSAHGLEHAHARGLIHRDIKPGNILVSKDGVAKILDLGLSKNTESSDGYSTAQGMTVGTPHYMSPEQARGSAQTDLRTDIYSLGVTLFHMLTGSPPFVAKTPEKIMEKHLKERAPKPSEIRPEVPLCVDALVARMMAKKPEERHADCETLIADIRRVMHGKMPLEVQRKGDSHAQMKSSHGSSNASHAAQTSHARIERPGSGEKTKNSKAAPFWRSPYLLYGISVAVLGIGGFLFINGGSTTKPETATAPAPELPTKPAEPPKTVAAPTALEKPATSPAPAKVEPKVVDLLESVKPNRNSVQGQWEFVDGGLQCDPGWGSRIEIPYNPPDEYDLRMTFTRLEGNDSVMVALSYKGQGFSYRMGDQNNTVCCFDVLNGLTATDSKNPTRKQAPGWITNEQKNNVRIEVRKDSVKAYFNGRPMAEFDPSKTKLDYNNGWRMRDGRILGIGSWQSKTQFHEIKLTELSGPGRFFR